MDGDLSAEIARIEAELARDNELRQQQQQQPTTSAFGAGQPQGHAPTGFTPAPVSASAFGFGTSMAPTQPVQTAAPLNQFSGAMASQPPVAAATTAAAAAGAVAAPTSTHVFSKDTDSRSVFVGNLPKGIDGAPPTTPEELAQFFGDCGEILNITVLKDRTTGELKGTAYIEFSSYTGMGRAIDTKNNANFKGSTIIVC